MDVEIAVYDMAGRCLLYTSPFKEGRLYATRVYYISATVTIPEAVSYTHLITSTIMPVKAQFMPEVCQLSPC